MAGKSRVPVGLKLRMLNENDEAAFNRAVSEFRQIQPVWEFAFEYDESQPFTAYVQKLKNWHQGKDLPYGWVPNTFLVAIVESEIVGRVSIRHSLNYYLETYGGHIGYGVVPKHRNRGYAKEILRQSLLEVKSFGLQKALVTTDENNLASIRVIEKNGGILKNSVAQPEVNIPKLRYWIDLT